MDKIKKVFTKELVFIIAITLFAMYFGLRKISQYLLNPVSEKDCPPLFPDTTGFFETNKIEINSLETQIPWIQKGGAINDASCLNRTYIHGVVEVHEIEDIKRILFFARKNDLKVSIAGVKHSMGGQAFFKNAVILDITKFNKMSLDSEHKILTVQSGATWHDIQNFINPYGLAVKVMQSSDIFTIGGSISVNAHGMDHRFGSIGSTIKSMRLMLADGSIRIINRNENPELFRNVIGGYGLFGVILDVDIELTNNLLYTKGLQAIDYQDFPKIFEQKIASDSTYELMYGYLSTAPSSFMQEMILFTYQKDQALAETVPPLKEVGNIKLKKLVLNFAKNNVIGKELGWFAQKYIEPHLSSCFVSRNLAMKEGEACWTARNQAMHDSMKYTENNTTKETDILQEYFIPKDKFVAFIDGSREILLKNKVNVLSVEVRVIHKEDITLNYATEDMFSVVVFLNQKAKEDDNKKVAETTRALIDLAIKHGGTFYLPYQLLYDKDQLAKAYPEINNFFREKRNYDPQLVFMNRLYEKYAEIK